MSAATGAASTPASAVRVALTGDALACLSCGVAVSAEEVAERGVTVVDAHARAGVPVSQNPDAPPTRLRFEFSRCARCADRERAAGLILDDLPRVVARLGADMARHRLTCALDGLAAVGATPPRTFDAATVSALLRHLAAPGASVRWASRFAPVVTEGARPGAANVEPWQHLGEEVARAVRDGWAAALAERVARSAPDARLAPPEGRGCAFCGVSHVTVPAVRVTALGGSEWAARRVWSTVKVSPRTFGGQHSPRPVTVALCPPCAEAVDATGAVGEPAMRRAFAAHLRGQGRDYDALLIAHEDVGPVSGWAAKRRKPNAGPWAHLRMPGEDA